MDKTNRIVKICREIEDIEYQLACKDKCVNEEEDLRNRLFDLEEELSTLQPANSPPATK